MPPEPPGFPLDHDRVQAVYDELAVGLQRFLLGVLKDDASAADVLQIAFIRLMEKGHLVQQEGSIKSWLYRVAFNEAMLIRRRAAVGRKHAEGMAWHFHIRGEQTSGGKLGQSIELVMRAEDVELVRQSLSQLSNVQREVVEKRIYEGKKFREIADELGVRLGTVLARMQSSLKKLKPILINRSPGRDE